MWLVASVVACWWRREMAKPSGRIRGGPLYITANDDNVSLSGIFDICVKRLSIQQ